MSLEHTGSGRHAAEEGEAGRLDSYDAVAVALWYDVLRDAGWSHDAAADAITDLYNATIPSVKRELYSNAVQEICLARSVPQTYVGIVKVNT